jgi:hypothetical protein
MKLANLLKSVVGAVTLFACLFQPAHGADIPYRSIDLAYGISLEAPSQWNALSEETRNAIGAAGESMSNRAGIGAVTGKMRLLDLHATPAPTGAIVRVNVTPRDEYTQAKLAKTSKEDLKAMRVDVVNVFKQVEAAGGPKILGVKTPRIERLDNTLALAITYNRAGAVDPSEKWVVTMYRIPRKDHTVELTLSYRQAQEDEWKPILEHVKKSVRL